MNRMMCALVALAGMIGCGDLSQEDLLFLAALPGKQNIEVQPAGQKSQAETSDEGQALEERCADGDLKCTAKNIATGFNGLTFGILAGIDFVVSNPPTERAKNRRVWGPHYDIEKNQTIRFEMLRSEDGTTFKFCLHLKKGGIKAGSASDITCDVDDDDDSGLELLLDGQFRPGDVEGKGARTGTGEMSLHISRFDDANPFGTRADIVFDNDDGERNVSIFLEGVRPDDDTERRNAMYEFHREKSGGGTFAFRVFVDLFRPANNQGPETIDITAAWKADQSGRARAVISGGDVPDGAPNSEHQCWNADFEDTYQRRYDQPATGDESTCTLDLEDLPPPATDE